MAIRVLNSSVEILFPSAACVAPAGALPAVDPPAAGAQEE
jgi:hypothetical protein